MEYHAQPPPKKKNIALISTILVYSCVDISFIRKDDISYEKISWYVNAIYIAKYKTCMPLYITD